MHSDPIVWDAIWAYQLQNSHNPIPREPSHSGSLSTTPSPHQVRAWAGRWIWFLTSKFPLMVYCFGMPELENIFNKKIMHPKKIKKLVMKQQAEKRKCFVWRFSLGSRTDHIKDFGALCPPQLKAGVPAWCCWFTPTLLAKGAWQQSTGHCSGSRHEINQKIEPNGFRIWLQDWHNQCRPRNLHLYGQTHKLYKSVWAHAKHNSIKSNNLIPDMQFGMLVA